MILPKEALKIIIEKSFQNKFEIIPIEESINRISFEDYFATFDIPRFNNSAMDGYGITKNFTKKLKIVDTILAGDYKDINISNDETIKITTGAFVPNSIDIVIPFEDVIEEKEYIRINKEPKKTNIRYIGEDIKEKEVFLKKGQKIDFSIITLLASFGITHIKVYKKPKVTILSSGNELKPFYSKEIKSYQLFNSNTPTLIARLKELNVDTIYIGQAKDTLEDIENFIKLSLDSDLIISTGGASYGEKDYTKKAFLNLGGKYFFDFIKIKPGKPTAFGKINDTLFLNLPGNPLASSLIFEYFGKILIERLKGRNYSHFTINAKTNQDININRTTIVSGYFDGEYFYPSKKAFAGMVNVLSKANSIALVEKNIKKYETIQIIPIKDLS